MAPRYTQTDDVDGAFKVIEQEHSLIHRGRLFTFSMKDLVLGDDAHLYAEMRVPSGYEVHFKDVALWMVDAPWTIRLVEAPTIGTPGTTPIPIMNRKRDSAAVPHMTVFSDPASISVGTELFNVLTGGGTGVGQTQTSGGAKQTLEWEFKEDTIYLLDIHNESGGAAAVSVIASFYEEAE